MTRSELNEHVRKMRILDPVDRRRYLQALIGSPSSSPGVLEARAQLMSALNEAGVWPARGRA